jgi:catechol 2,3-dioxygenase-like lactoylglutathione lyase family enzyme
MIRLQNATYMVHDLDEGIRFFVDSIGGFIVREDETNDAGRRRVVVGPEQGGPGFVLALAPLGSDFVGLQAGGKVAFFLETDDFAAQHARMIAHGITFREAPRHESYGTVAVFEDMNGMPWDLIQPPHL